MRFSCTKENLSLALSLTSGLTGKNSNLPILGSVLLKADQQKVDVIATNLELAIVVSVRAKIDLPGTFTVPSRTLAEFVALLPNEKVDVELVGNELLIHCAKSTTKIKGGPADEFPIIPTLEDGKGFSVGRNDLKSALSQVLPAVAKNEIRPELAGVFFGFTSEADGGNKLTLASTDSYRLAERVVPVTQATEECRVVVPGRTAQEINHCLLASGDQGDPTVSLILTDNQISVRHEGVQIISRLVEGNYPDYAQIIPTQFKTTAVISVDKLNKELKAAGVFTTSGVNAATLTFKPTTGVVEITSASLQTGDYHSEFPAEITGAEVTVFLNHRYVLDGLSAAGSDTVEIKIVDGDSPCLITVPGNNNFRYVVMPIRQ
ncbi:MAG: DNA polymerase III subunit beta [Candidatus Magasanikbacteria bacterium]|nr:DNA polymerase III subunit beta [Candidatus Magasanikbacteria bacterium]